MDRGGWWATAHGVTKSQTRLSDFTSLCWTGHLDVTFKPRNNPVKLLLLLAHFTGEETEVQEPVQDHTAG